MAIGKGKRPHHPNQLAACNVASPTDHSPEPQPSILQSDPDGKGRLKTMTKEQRSKIPAKAAKARRKKQSKQPNVWPFP